jgi:hypothetical protein
VKIKMQEVLFFRVDRREVLVEKFVADARGMPLGGTWG